jgi:hypothetical protein
VICQKTRMEMDNNTTQLPVQQKEGKDVCFTEANSLLFMLNEQYTLFAEEDRKALMKRVMYLLLGGNPLVNLSAEELKQRSVNQYIEDASREMEEARKAGKREVFFNIRILDVDLLPPLQENWVSKGITALVDVKPHLIMIHLSW